MPRSVLRACIQAFVILVTASAAGIAFNWHHIRTASVPSATAAAVEPLPLGIEQAQQLFAEGALFIDAREAAAYAAGHVKGATSVPLGEAETRLESLPARAAAGPVVVYCNGNGCPDSLLLAGKLIGRGFRRVYVFEGGFPEWAAAGGDVAGGRQ